MPCDAVADSSGRMQTGQMRAPIDRGDGGRRRLLDVELHDIRADGRLSVALDERDKTVGGFRAPGP